MAKIKASFTASKGAQQTVKGNAAAATRHPDYTEVHPEWVKVRDCIKGETRIKSKTTTYLPQPEGMKGDYEDSYTAYVERAHFPQVCSYSLQGALGVVITKLPEFNVPPELEYLLTDATKEGDSLSQLFMDIIVDIFATGRCPLVVDIVEDTNEFKFVKYSAESFINWKQEVLGAEKNLILAVFEEEIPKDDDLLSHDVETIYRVLHIDKDGNYASRIFDERGEVEDMFTSPSYMGTSLPFIPVFVGGSINTNVNVQPIPLLSVANCSIQIYRKEADLANSEFLSCNPTLIMTGVSNDDNLPNVVGSSVLINLPDPASRAFYTTTDTAALKHVSDHIKDLYEEAIRHGVSILDARKGVEAAEALRIRQATQSASIYSIYLSAVNVIREGLLAMCEWGGYDKEKVIVEAPNNLTTGIPDSTVIKEIIEGFGRNVVPLTVIHRYLVDSGLIDQKIGFDEYKAQLEEQVDIVTASSEFANPKQPEVPTTEEEPSGDSEVDKSGAGTEGKPAPKKPKTKGAAQAKKDTKDKKGGYTA